MHDREHQGAGAEGLPAHVGKDRNTEAAHDETGIEDAAQGLKRGWWALKFEWRGTGSCLLTLKLDSGPASSFSSL